jgi:primary-amine oxidase
MRRGGWATETLWATPHTAGERFASGLYVPDGSTDVGLVAWTAANRPLADTDLVLWFSVGFHHIVRSEDLPNMPAHEAYFGLMPANAYPYNPYLDLPRPSGPGG